MKRFTAEYLHRIAEPLPLTKRLPVDIALETPCSTRKEAKEVGDARYFTGRPCSRGHLSDRYTKAGACYECMLGANADSRNVEIRDVPPCIRGKFRKAACSICKFKSTCVAVFANSTLTRAQLAFPKHEPITQLEALAAQMTIYKPATPCPTCGYQSWRKIAGGRCAVCYLRLLDENFYRR